MITTMFVLVLAVFGNTALAAVDQVYDQANLFTEPQRAELLERANMIGEQFEIDIAIVTTNDNEGKTSRQYAEDFYNQHGFGFGDTSDGILYLLDMDNREVYIYTRDKAFDYISDGRVNEILDVVYPYLPDGSYSESVHVFLAEVEKAMQEGLSDPYAPQSESSYVENDGYAEEPSLQKELLIYFGISIVIGGLTILIMAMYNRGRSTVNEGTYLINGSFVVTRRVDQHYDTRVTQQRIQSNTNSGGGFGGSGGGSGSRSGGGGRGF